MTSPTTENRQPKDERCPQCNSEEVEFNELYNYYFCNNCEHCWAYDEADPDYHELEEESDQLYYGPDEDLDNL